MKQKLIKQIPNIFLTAIFLIVSWLFFLTGTGTLGALAVILMIAVVVMTYNILENIFGKE